MSTSSLTSARLGVQQPRLQRRPLAARSDGHRELIRLCDDSGLSLYEWQQQVLALWMGEAADGTLAARACGVNVGRQNGKGAILEAFGLDSLFVSKLSLTIWSAHEFDTAREHYSRLSGLIKADPLLDAKVESYYQSNARTAIVLKNGNRIEFKARTGAGGRGFSAPRVILDEAMFLTDAMMGALFPTMAAQSMGDDQAQLVYAGSAPLEKSSVWRRVRKRAFTGEGADRLAYAEWSVDEDDFDVWDRDGWYQANPSLGLRISEEYVHDEYFEIGEAEFVRERLGVPDPDPQSFEASFPADAWAACESLRVKIGKVSAIGVDVDPDQVRASIGLAGDVDGLVAVEVPECRPMGEWLVPRVLELQRTYGGQVVLQAAGGAASILPDLVAAGVPLVAMSSRDVYAACGRLSNRVLEQRLRHRGEPHLSAAVMRARRRRVGDAFVWNRRDVADDLTPLYAVTLAAWPQAEEKKTIWMG